MNREGVTPTSSNRCLKQQCYGLASLQHALSNQTRNADMQDTFDRTRGTPSDRGIDTDRSYTNFEAAAQYWAEKPEMGLR